MQNRLPYPGQSDWGDMLNNFLAEEHNIDGTHKNDDVASLTDKLIALQERLEMLEVEVEMLSEK